MFDWWTIIATAIVASISAIGVMNFITAERRLRRPPPRWYATHDEDFKRTTSVLLGPAILDGNNVEMLVNGEQIYPAMLRAIDDARCSITFETFIYWSGKIGIQFADAFMRAVHRGVAVHILLDWMGTRRMDPHLLERLRAAGAQVEIYHPLSWYHLGRINNRTHRKLLIIDGEVGFTGGVGIADHWTGNAQNARHWRDTHYRVTGPVVSQMQAVFVDNWIKATGEVLHGENYFRELAASGDMSAQMFGSSPAGGSDSMHLLIMLALTAAHRSIDIANSYFVPDLLCLQALIAARKRGVRVRILVPGRHIDVPLVRRASQAQWSRLLKSGVEIYEFSPTMLHCKSTVVDRTWVSVGSANFDNRSFRLNDEANLNVFSESLAQAVTLQFEQDLQRARRIKRVKWYRRTNARKMMEWVASRLQSQL
jgi:cardiolipin synthase A/B